MRSFLRYLSLLSIMITFTWVAVPRRFDIEFPRQPGPDFDRQMRKTYINILDENKTDIVLIGDSTLRLATDPGLLSELTEKSVENIDFPGSASAFWYLVIKNNLVVAEHRPEAVVIVFRDTMLTAPGYRVHGAYFAKLAEFAAPEEPVLLEKAYLNQMGIVAKWSEKYFPLYSAREDIQKEIDSQIRYTLPRWLNCDQFCTDQSMYAIFTASDLEPGQLRTAIATAEGYLYTPSQLNFERQVDKSFLPNMIRLTKERGIPLIAVRLKTQSIGAGNLETSEIRQYIEELSDYLNEQGVIFLDYGHDSRLDSEHFTDSIHLNAKGEELFTQILAEDLNEILK
jgi:hypothetical protein